jgi:lysophospholipase L1-like esterase
MTLAHMTALAVLLLAAPLGAHADVAAAAKPRGGITADSCAGVPVKPTAAHQAAADPYAAWMGEWRSLDWGQLCRYRDENAALPPATARRIVMIGDSITEGWKETDPSFFGNDVLDRGISGQTTSQMLVRFRRDVLDLHPAVVHIMAGTNDIAGNSGPVTYDIVQGNLESMVEQAKSHGIRVVLAAIPPAAKFSWVPEIQPVEAIRTLNAWLHAYAEREHLVWVDYGTVLDDGRGGIRPQYADDGVHANAAGYAAMRPLAADALRRALASR